MEQFVARRLDGVLRVRKDIFLVRLLLLWDFSWLDVVIVVLVGLVVLCAWHPEP